MTSEGYQLQLDVLGSEPYVYPGHAVTLERIVG
jgi:hypothetical protein